MPAKKRTNRLHLLLMTAAIAAIVLPVGCGPAPVNLFNQAKPATPAQPAYDDKDWAAVLRENVRDRLVDYRHLAEHREPLDAYLRQVEMVGPKSTPGLFGEPQAPLAYYLNVYNACVLKAVLAAGIPPTMHDVHGVSLDYGYRFRVEGQIVTLAQIREMAREASVGNARFELALCDAAIGSPPIPAEPFRPYNVDEHLQRIAREAIDDPNLVRVDHEHQRLLVGLPIWSHREEFLAMYCRETGSSSATMLNVLMHLASGIRRQYLSRASGYDVRLLPFDRRLNIWQAASGG